MTDNPASSPTPPPPSPGAPGAGGDGSAPRGAGSGFFGWLRTLGLARGDAWVGGVCGAIAARLGIDPLIVRGIFVVAAILGLPMLLVYAILWVVLPDRSGAIHLESLFHGRLEPPTIAALVIVVLSFVPVTPWLSNLLLWGGGSWGGVYDIGGALSVLWRGLLVLALIGLVIVAIVAIARRPRHRGPGSAQTGFDPYGPGAASHDPRGYGAAPYGATAQHAGPAPYAGAAPTGGAWPVPRLDTPTPAPAAFAAGQNGTVSAPNAPASSGAGAATFAAGGHGTVSAPNATPSSSAAGATPRAFAAGQHRTASAAEATAISPAAAAAMPGTEELASDGSVFRSSTADRDAVRDGDAIADDGTPSTNHADQVRGADAGSPAAPAWHEGAPATPAPVAASAGYGVDSAAGAPTTAPGTEPVTNAPYDTWRQQQDQWRAEHDAWRQQQRDAERIAREQARAEAAEATARANREYEEARARRRASRPRTALWYVALTLGVMAVGGAAVALVAAPRGTMMAATLAFLTATAVGAVAMIVAGIARRRSGFIAFLTISSLVIAAGTLVPALSVGRPWSDAEVARVDGEALLPLGSASIAGPDPSDRTYLQSFGFTHLYLSPWMADDQGYALVEPEPVPTATAVPAPSSSPAPSASVATPSLIAPVRSGSITLEKGSEGNTQIELEPGMIVEFTVTASAMTVTGYPLDEDGVFGGDQFGVTLPAPRINDDGTSTWSFTVDTRDDSLLVSRVPDAHTRPSVVTEVTITQQDEVWIDARLMTERQR